MQQIITTHLLNQVHAGHRPIHAWFLVITFVCKCMHTCVCTPPQAIKSSGVIFTLNDLLNNCGSFSVPFYGSCCLYHRALAVYIIDRRGPSNTKCVASYKDLGKAILAVYIAAKDILPALHY